MYQPIQSAAALFFAQSQPDARRVFHGRGHLHENLTHINVDWFSPVLLISAYEDIENVDELAACLLAADELGQIRSIQVQYRKRKGTPTELLSGEDIKRCEVTEGPLRFEVQPGVNQNAGLFLDMRPLRQWLLANSEGKNTLNLFAYTCSLSVAALTGGGTQAVNVDMSKTSISWGSRNHDLNDHDARAVKTIPHNLFRSWGRIKQFGRYHQIIIDPPTRQRGSFDVEKNYGAVLKKLHQMTAPGADVIATVNSPYLGLEFLQNQFARYAPECTFMETIPASPEFADRFPERGLIIGRFKSK